MYNFANGIRSWPTWSFAASAIKSVFIFNLPINRGRNPKCSFGNCADKQMKRFYYQYPSGQVISRAHFKLNAYATHASIETSLKFLAVYYYYYESHKSTKSGQYISREIDRGPLDKWQMNRKLIRTHISIASSRVAVVLKLAQHVDLWSTWMAAITRSLGKAEIGERSRPATNQQIRVFVWNNIKSSFR